MRIGSAIRKVAVPAEENKVRISTRGSSGILKSFFASGLPVVGRDDIDKPLLLVVQGLGQQRNKGVSEVGTVTGGKASGPRRNSVVIHVLRMDLAAFCHFMSGSYITLLWCSHCPHPSWWRW